MDDQLLSLLEYDGVLSAVAATPDGLVVAAAGLHGDDAEIVGAAASIILSTIDQTGEESGSMEVESAAIHLFRGAVVSLVVLSEAAVPHGALVSVAQESLESVSGVFA